MARTTLRMSASLPKEMVEDLDFIAKSFRVSRSALLTQLLDEAVVGLKHICEQHVLPLDDSRGNKKETERAIQKTLDRLANEIASARSAYGKSTRH